MPPRWSLFLSTWRKLEDMKGLHSVKEEVKEMIFQVHGNQLIENKGIKIKKPSLHLLLEGNAGTGKTEVARLLATLLYCLGLIKENKCIEVDQSIIIGTYIGHTEKKFKTFLNKSIEGVLFLDEAHSLNKEGRDFGKEAVDVLVKYMEDHRDNLVVIAAGYPQLIDGFLNMNPDLTSHFKKKIVFPDYTPAELKEILEKTIQNSGMPSEKGVNKELEAAFNRLFRNKTTIQGNARAVKNLADKIIQTATVRIGKQPEKNHMKILVEDVKKAVSFVKKMDEKSSLKLTKEKAVNDLNKLIGLDPVKQQVITLINTVTMREIKRIAGIPVSPIRMHTVFIGNPGTGKTTIARILADFYKGSGLLSKGHFIETNRSGLVAEYLGQTATKVHDIIKQAAGGVLFIDEAYSLYQGENDLFGREAIDTLIVEIEKGYEDFVLILAGYQNEMQALFASNPGFNLRMEYSFHFPNYDKEEMKQIIQFQLEKLQLEAGQELTPTLDKLLASVEFFDGNAHWASKLTDYVQQEQMNRLATVMENVNDFSIEELKQVLPEDVEAAFAFMHLQTKMQEKK